ncbi:hypothetical protein MLD38_003388 [Melastoma candidum]|nr:hypothetical protein MLD38_003388 [Melastoma candidum]
MVVSSRRVALVRAAVGGNRLNQEVSFSSPPVISLLRNLQRVCLLFFFCSSFLPSTFSPIFSVSQLIQQRTNHRPQILKTLEGCFVSRECGIAYRFWRTAGVEFLTQDHSEGNNC